MTVTHELMQKYVGSNVRLRRVDDNYFLQGPIASISLEGEGRDLVLIINFDWLARCEGTPKNPGAMTRVNLTRRTIQGVDCHFWDMGDDSIDIVERSSSTIIHFLPPGSKGLALP
jgi:hypothetical protein